MNRSTNNSAMTHSDFTSTTHFSSLDGIRCFAILGVLWHHSSGADPVSNPIFSRGYLGVDLFFVLSGFLITNILIREKVKSGTISLKKFYIRRTLRIFPLYYGYLVALGLLCLVKGGEQLTGYLEVLPMYIFYLTNWIPNSVDHIFERGWSLAVEEQFYMVWPLLLLALGVRTRFYFALSFIALIMLMALNLSEGQWHELVRNLVPFRTIVLGGVLAMLLNSRRFYEFFATYLGKKYSIFGVCAAALMILLTVDGPLSATIELCIHLVMFALVGSAVVNQENGLKNLLTSKLVSKIGLVSYGIYIVHGQFWGVASSIAQMIPHAIISESRITFFLIFATVNFLVALVIYYFFEVQFLKLKSKLAP